jgi:high-affinity Fe2+/Pb2+ permease
MIAAEALGLATLNVFSFGIMLTGGIAWAWDISTLEDLRTRARQKLYGEAGALDEDAEKQMEEWMAKVLSGMKKEDGDKIEKELEKGKRN